MKINKLLSVLVVLGLLIFGDASVNAQSIGTPNGNTSTFFSTNNTGRLLGHREGGTFGSFSTGSQWIGIGQPTVSTTSSVKVPAYGLRSQWQGQAGIFSLKNSGAVKDLVVEWGANIDSRLRFSFIEDLNNPSALKEIMTISPRGLGSVGIGTTTPAATFDVVTAQSATLGSTSIGIRSAMTSGNFSVIAGNFQMRDISAFSATGVQANVTTTNTFSASGGFFNITNNTTSSLHNTYGVYARASASAGNVWAGYFIGDVFVSGTITHASDRKFKTNIKALNSGTVTAKLMDLKPATYLYKNSDDIKFSEGTQYGFVAQEVEKVFPDLVNDIEQPVYEGVDEQGNPKIVEGKSIKFKSVNYTGLIPVLTTALQEHETSLSAYTAELEEQKAINAEQNAINEELRATNAELKQKLDQLFAAMELGGNDSAIDTPAATETSLGQNMPNPFGQATEITYSLASTVRNANIQIYNMDGKLLADYRLDKDANSIQLQANEYQPGVYIYVMMADGETIGTRRMIVSQ